MKLSYYPGCTLKTKGKALDAYGRAAAEKLGIEMEELADWQCCGAVYPLAEDEIATRLSAVRALMAAREQGQPLLTLCSACHHVIKRVNNDMKCDDYVRTRVNNYLKPETPYAGETQVLHYLELLRDGVGFENVKKAVAKPLKGVKIGAYYGCLLLRPSRVMAFDDPENPSIMEELIAALGATPVRYSMRNECCGGYIAMEDKDAAVKRVDRILQSAKDAGADMLITACPLCMYNLQANASEQQLPVRYFTDVLAEALGVKEGDA